MDLAGDNDMQKIDRLIHRNVRTYRQARRGVTAPSTYHTAESGILSNDVYHTAIEDVSRAKPVLASVQE
jgi:hypothetical protein